MATGGDERLCVGFNVRAYHQCHMTMSVVCGRIISQCHAHAGGPLLIMMLFFMIIMLKAMHWRHASGITGGPPPHKGLNPKCGPF